MEEERDAEGGGRRRFGEKLRGQRAQVAHTNIGGMLQREPAYVRE